LQFGSRLLPQNLSQRIASLQISEFVCVDHERSVQRIGTKASSGKTVTGDLARCFSLGINRREIGLEM
jgi:hypothetical protein